MLPVWYEDYRFLIEKNIKKTLKEIFSQFEWTVLEDFKEMIFYATEWGKRFRSVLALETYSILSGKNISQIDEKADIWKWCVAIEIMHSFSLVHDDLPAMDNDEYRRGKLTVWKKYGEYQAILVWDLLNTLSFEILSMIENWEHSKKLVKLLSSSISLYGMIGGQIEDMYFEKNISSLDKLKLESLHNKKTGKLIQASLIGGAILAGKENFTEILQEFWKNLGLAFQIKDDILDVEGTKEESGKSVGGEEKGFVYIYWLEKSKKILANLQKKCLEEIQAFSSEKLKFIVHYVVERRG